MFKRIPYSKHHMLYLLEQSINQDPLDDFSRKNAEHLERTQSLSGLWNGDLVVSGGVLPIWHGRGHVWCIFNERSKYNFIPVFRGIKKYLEEQMKIFHRIEVSVPVDFSIGRRRAEMLGFKLECECAKGFFPTNTDASIYVMTRG